jgi:hypothetical protein
MHKCVSRRKSITKRNAPISTMQAERFSRRGELGIMKNLATDAVQPMKGSKEAWQHQMRTVCKVSRKRREEVRNGRRQWKRGE